MDSDKSDTISVKFKEKIYAIWKFHFHTFVEGKDLSEMLDSSILKPQDDEKRGQ